MKRLLVFIAALAIIATACGDSATTTTAETAATTTTAPAATTTTAAATTTAAPTTTAPATTATTAAPSAVPPTPIVGFLDPYSPGGADLFPPGSVEAHWYRWDGLYVVLYRGFDASGGSQICAGNSIQVEGVGFGSVTNSPHNGEVDEICIDAVKIAESPSGVYSCDSLLYYVTEIPTDVEGTSVLWGTLELGDGEWNGQTSQAWSDLANTPEFEPNLPAYDLPETTADPGGVVSCS
ncbi:MAG: hypothetical protein ACR2N7_03460 [Acidimicrobiia bacterium]